MKIYSVVLLPALNPTCFYSNYLFGFGFKPVQDYFQYDSAPMVYEADTSVVLAKLWRRSFSCSLVSVTDRCEAQIKSCWYIINSCRLCLFQ